MRTELIRFHKHTAPATAPAGSLPGTVDGDTVICAVDNTPDHVPTSALLNRLRGLFPGDGVIRVDFADLPKPRDGQCCGGCGG